MNEKRIREKYQRNDPEDARGLNKGGIDNFISMLNTHENCSEKTVQTIAKNFEAIESLSPNFTIFESSEDKKCFFMHQFKALQIGKNTDLLVASHEFGHAVLSMTSGVEVPENFGEILAGAKAHALSPENKETFKAYVEFLCKYGKEVTTEAEKGPVSDIISSIFQRQGLRIGSQDNICWFPASHTHEYYTKKDSDEPNLKTIYDEDFANFYALKATDSKKEIETLKTLFGEEFIKTLENQLQKSADIIEKTAEQNKSKLNPAKDIVPVIQEVKAQEILEVAQAGKKLEMEEQEKDSSIKE